MKVLPEKIRQLRESRSWTQEHLATVAGLSLRTVQRIERDGNLSADSRMALAASFEIDAALLSDQPPPLPDPVPKRPNPADGPKFRDHLILYLIIGSGFVIGDLWQNHALTWAYWPLLGWGLGLALHARHIRQHTRADGPILDDSALRRRAIWEHVAAYLVMCPIFVIGDLWQTGHLTWAYYPILGWGLGLWVHGRQVLRATRPN